MEMGIASTLTSAGQYLVVIEEEEWMLESFAGCASSSQVRLQTSPAQIDGLLDITNVGLLVRMIPWRFVQICVQVVDKVRKLEAISVHRGNIAVKHTVV